MGIKNGTLALGGDTMHYVRFGRGKKTLIMLPGLGDGLTTVKGTAIPMAMMYRIFSKEYTVFMFSRRNALPAGYTTRDMARDLTKAMDILNIPCADVIGVSMGGMIATHFAADYPDRTGKLVLVVSCAASSDALRRAVSEWIACAKRGDHTAFMDSNVRLIYSDAYYRKNRWLTPIVGKITRPADYGRFFIQAQACVAHDARDRLAQITARTLVIGGEQDQIVGKDAARELAEAIPGAVLKIYPEWGHGLYEEARDFLPLVLDFLTAPPSS